MESILIKTSQTGTSSWTDLKTPSTYRLTYNDTDNDSFRSVINGDLKRNRIQPRWIKLEISYNKCTDAELDTIARAVNTNQYYYVRCKSPAFGNMNSAGSTSASDKTWVEFQAYTSNYSAEMIDAQVGWNVSFNIIQAVHGSFQ